MFNKMICDKIFICVLNIIGKNLGLGVNILKCIEFELRECSMFLVLK